MKIGDRVFVHGYVDEIRKDVVIIRNNGGYFGTVKEEVVTAPEEVERKTGRWIKHPRGYWTFVNEKGERDGWLPEYECSVCGSMGWNGMQTNMNFCPNCGAKMEVENEQT